MRSAVRELICRKKPQPAAARDAVAYRDDMLAMVPPERIAPINRVKEPRPKKPAAQISLEAHLAAPPRRDPGRPEPWRRRPTAGAGVALAAVQRYHPAKLSAAELLALWPR